MPNDAQSSARGSVSHEQTEQSIDAKVFAAILGKQCIANSVTSDSSKLQLSRFNQLLRFEHNALLLEIVESHIKV